MRRKVALTAAAVAMVGTLAVGGTLAWFTDTETATNVVTTGNVDITWVENGDDITEENTGIDFGDKATPGAELDKVAEVRNDGKNVALIRATVTVTPDTVSDFFDVNYTPDSNWVNGGDGYYYYLRPVQPGETTDSIISSISIATNAGNEAADSERIQIKLVADAIQAENIIMNLAEFEEDETKVLGVDDVMVAFSGVEIEDYEATAIDGE